MAGEDLKYKLQLERKKMTAPEVRSSISLQTDTLEELGEILFSSPGNLAVEGEVTNSNVFMKESFW